MTTNKPKPASSLSIVQLLIFGGLFIVAALFIFAVIAWSAGFLGEWLKGSTKAQIIMNRVAGTILTSLAIRLAVSER